MLAYSGSFYFEKCHASPPRNHFSRFAQPMYLPISPAMLTCKKEVRFSRPAGANRHWNLTTHPTETPERKQTPKNINDFGSPPKNWRDLTSQKGYHPKNQHAVHVICNSVTAILLALENDGTKWHHDLGEIFPMSSTQAWQWLAVEFMYRENLRLGIPQMVVVL